MRGAVRTVLASGNPLIAGNSPDCGAELAAPSVEICL